MRGWRLARNQKRDIQHSWREPQAEWGYAMQALGLCALTRDDSWKSPKPVLKSDGKEADRIWCGVSHPCWHCSRDNRDWCDRVIVFALTVEMEAPYGCFVYYYYSRRGAHPGRGMTDMALCFSADAIPIKGPDPDVCSVCI